MKAHATPAGHHDADSAATQLDMSKNTLLKRMRELGWLYTGRQKFDGTHNLPKRELIEQGLMTTQTRTYGLRGDHKAIGKSYQVMLLTQKGYQTLKQHITDQPKDQPNNPQNKDSTVQTHPTATASTTPSGTTHNSSHNSANNQPRPMNRAKSAAERDKALQQLKDWGLTG